MSSDVVRWLPIDNKCKNERDRCSSQLHDRISDSVAKSIVVKLVFLVLVINFNIGLVLADKDVKEPEDDGYGHYTPHWAVHMPDVSEEAAQLVADQHGFIYLGKIIDDYYHFHHNSVSKRSISPSHRHQGRLDEDHRVRWSKQQRAKSRRKRDFLRLRQPQSSNFMPWNDPKWTHMWYLNRGNGLDMNVIPAWKEGITGKGIVVTILDDGLESDHPDLQQNYNACRTPSSTKVDATQPVRNVVQRAIIQQSVPQKQCDTCHFSCLNCRGPNDYDCIECTPDSALTNKSQNESYCSSINQLPVHNPSAIGDSTYVFLLILGPAVVVLIFVVVVSCVIKSKLCGSSRKQDYIYDRIDFDAQNDDIGIRIDDIPINVSGGSDEEEVESD